MSKSEQIREIAYNLLHSNGQCNLSELQNELKAHNIYLSADSALPRAVMSQLVKSDSKIKRSKRGNYVYTQYTEVYKMNTSLDLKNNNEFLNKLEQAEQIIQTIIGQIQNFDWINCSDDELQYMRLCAQRLQSLQKNLSILK